MRLLSKYLYNKCNLLSPTDYSFYIIYYYHANHPGYIASHPGYIARNPGKSFCAYDFSVFFYEYFLFTYCITLFTCFFAVIILRRLIGDYMIQE